MFCENCGCELTENSDFCKNCNAKISDPHEKTASTVQEPEKSTPDSGNSVPAGIRKSPNIVGDSNGVMRWIYEFSLWKNPTILISVWKVLLISCGFVGLLTFFVTISDGFVEAVKTGFMTFGIAAGIITSLMLIVYPVFCMINGGKYSVLFEMDHKGIKHTQLDRQFEKAQTMGLLTAFLGGVTGNFSAAGAGLLSASRQSVYTSFQKIRRVSIKKRRNVIYIGETLEQNQVYAGAEDFQFVCNYILEHCNKNAKIKK